MMAFFPGLFFWKCWLFNFKFLLIFWFLIIFLVNKKVVLFYDVYMVLKQRFTLASVGQADEYYFLVTCSILHNKNYLFRNFCFHQLPKLTCAHLTTRFFYRSTTVSFPWILFSYIVHIYRLVDSKSTFWIYHLWFVIEDLIINLRALEPTFATVFVVVFYLFVIMGTI